MKRQTLILATFLIAVFTAVTILAMLSAANHPITLTEENTAFTQHNDSPSTPLYLPTPYLPTPTPMPLPTSEPSPTPTPSPSPTVTS